MSDKFIPKINDFFINILAQPGITDGRENEISSHEIPFSQKNILINTGKKTEETSFTCVFQERPPLTAGQNSTSGVLPTYDNHFDFLTLIDSGVSIEFIHPTYGLYAGQIKKYSSLRRDEQKYVEIQITFWREISDVTTTFQFEPDESTAKDFRESTLINQDKVEALIQDNPESSFKARLNNYIANMNSFFSGITSPIDSIVNTVDYLESQAGDVMFSINDACDRMVTSIVNVSNTPSALINNLIANARVFKATLLEADGSPTLESIFWNNLSAARISYETAIQYKIDDTQRETSLLNIDKRTFDDNGRFLGVSESVTIMSTNELEQTSQDVRSYIDEAIQADRDNRSLSNQARILQQYIDEIKVQRDQIITVQTNTTSLIELMKQYGISYKRVNENLALNPDVQNPNFIEGNIRLLAPSV